MLTATGCRMRQERLRQALAENRIDAAIISDPLEVYYFTGLLLPRVPHLLAAFLWIDAQSIWLVAPMNMGQAAVDEVMTYEWSHNFTTNADWNRRINQLVAARLSGSGSVRRIGWQAEMLLRLLGNTVDAAVHPDEWIAIDDLIADMESRKDPDEIDLIRRSVQINEAAYKAVQQTIKPGVKELDVLLAGQQAAHHEAGEIVVHMGDYTSATAGGWARDRQIEAGELYVVDAWTYARGYWADMSRTFIVGDEITPLQQSIFDVMKHVHDLIPSVLVPGADGIDVWKFIDGLIRQHPSFAESGIPHHGGHNIGLRAHEMPDLNPDRGGWLEVGNVVCVEPGGYTPAARIGVRLENMYLLTENGTVSLSVFPMSLR